MKKFVFSNPEEMKKFAQNFTEEILLRRRQKKDALILALIGGLGSGKTVFAQNFAKALGVKERIKSPTFIIFRKSKIIPLSARQKSKFRYFYHFDAYRIRDGKEILNLGWKEIINNPQNIVLVEWADKIKKILPKNYIQINFKHKSKNKREVIIS